MIFSDDRLVAFNKPPGLSLATSRNKPDDAVSRLTEILSQEDRKVWGVDAQSLWLVHRLDIGTSGLVLVARDAEYHRLLVSAFADRRIEKTYLALVWGSPRPAVGGYAWPLAPDVRDRRRMRVADGGKLASSSYRVLATAPHVSLVELVPHTGRTHQLRVHLAHAGHPVVGDDLYGGPRHRGVRDARLRRHLAPGHTLLHAWRLALPALANQPPLVLAAPLPTDFAAALAELGGRISAVAREAGLVHLESKPDPPPCARRAAAGGSRGATARGDASRRRNQPRVEVGEAVKDVSMVQRRFVPPRGSYRSDLWGTRAGTIGTHREVPMIDAIRQHLGDKVGLLDYTCQGIPKSMLHLPGPDFVDRIFIPSDRPVNVLKALSWMLGTGRLAGSGYLSILPVDQGIEHSAAASFAPNPIYMDGENIIRLAMEGGCNAVASTLGVLGSVARRWAHRIPFIVKLNHNETLTYPLTYDQTMYGTVEQAFNLGAADIGATIYFGSAESRRQIQEVSEAFQAAHELGMFTVLWCYTRNSAFKKDGVDYHTSADLTGQANHIGVTIEADIIKQKQPECQGGYTAVGFGHTSKLVYEKLAVNNPIEWTRWQVANCYLGRMGMINSGGASGANDLAQAVLTAVVNKRAGGMGLISGRKAFQKPMADGVALLHAIQDVYLCPDVTIA